jgi:hypothetical protein
MLAAGTINASDIALLQTTDDVEEAMAIVRRSYAERIAAEGHPPLPLRVLRESGAAGRSVTR